MSLPIQRTEKTSSDKQQLGFEYQYLYFILQLLHMQKGDAVGYECLDDVHSVSARDGVTTYIQIKHTIGTTINGKQVNLTKLSEDLWKPLSNWSKVISDPASNRLDEASQISFLNESRFILVVNRDTSRNPFCQKVVRVKAGKINVTSLRQFLEALKEESDNDLIRGYITDILSLSDMVLYKFLSYITIESGSNDIIQEIRESIREKMIQENYIDDVWKSLYTHLRSDFFMKVRKREHQVLAYDDWIREYSIDFQQFRTTLLPFRKYRPILPEHLEEQFFVKELVEIGAITLDDLGLPDIAELTRFYLTMSAQLKDWYNEGEISRTQLDKFHSDSFNIWKVVHRASHRSTALNGINDCNNALTCYDETMKKELKMCSAEIGSELSNGEFILLANESKIGWRYKWRGVGRWNGDTFFPEQ